MQPILRIFLCPQINAGRFGLRIISVLNIQQDEIANQTIRLLITRIWNGFHSTERKKLVHHQICLMKITRYLMLLLSTTPWSLSTTQLCDMLVYYIKAYSLLAHTWWRHQMEAFSALLALCAGISPVPVNSPHKGQRRGALMLSLICAWMNDWVNNCEAGDLRRVHYDVIVMDGINGKWNGIPPNSFCTRLCYSIRFHL